MKKISGWILVALLLLTPLFTGNSIAQEKWIYNKSIQKRTPVPYPYLREADVMWAKRVWRLVDLRQKKNFPLYYPTKQIGDRMSLIDVILGEIESGTVNAYSADAGDDMTIQITQADIDKKFGAGADTIQVPDANGVLQTQVIQNERTTSEVKQYIIQEVWYFDKKLSALNVRILGLCPIRISANPETNQMEKRKVFWIYYPDFRYTFANHEAYNPYNDAQKVSFDDLFLQRRFSGYILGESNVYNNRMISEYEQGRAALLESDRIKQSIFNMEQDLWEY